MNIKRLTVLVLLAIAGIGALYAAVVVTKKDSPAAGKISVSASFYPLYEFAAQVGGDKVDVTNITPAGAEPHDFEPTPQALVAAQKSRIFIYNGGTMEPWVERFLPDYSHLAIKASDGIELRATSEGQDPHFWLDPVFAQRIVASIRDGLIKIDPQNADYYRTRAADYTAQLAQLDTDFTSGLRSCSVHTVVTAHSAFSYIAKRYNFEAAAIAGLSPDEEPSAGKLAELTQLMRDKNIHYVFFESLASPRLAATIAQETGAQTAVFDPLEGLTNDAQKQGKNYVTVQRENLAALRSALACK